MGGRTVQMEVPTVTNPIKQLGRKTSPYRDGPMTNTTGRSYHFRVGQRATSRHAMAKRKPGRPSKRAKQRRAQAKHTPELRKLRKQFEKNELKASPAADCDATHQLLSCRRSPWLVGLPRKRGSAKLQKAMAKESNTTTSEPQAGRRSLVGQRVIWLWVIKHQ